VVITRAAKYRLASIYAFRIYVADGGLISYGANGNDLWTKAAGYVDRVLRGQAGRLARPGSDKV
jgi:putative ABC transport system substrate-binding protein